MTTRDRILNAALLLAFFGLFAMSKAYAQRVTPCNQATPNNAVCLQWAAVTTRTDGAPVTGPISYRVEQQTGNGAFASIGTTTQTRQYVQNLAPNTYLFRVYAIEGALESAPSNSASRTIEPPIAPPNAPVITIAVIIRHNMAPVYRVLGDKPPYRVGEFYGVVPAGRPCGDYMFTFRGVKFHRVVPESGELWYTSNYRGLAAPCAQSSQS